MLAGDLMNKFHGKSNIIQRKRSRFKSALNTKKKVSINGSEGIYEKNSLPKSQKKTSIWYRPIRVQLFFALIYQGIFESQSEGGGDPLIRDGGSITA